MLSRREWIGGAAALAAGWTVPAAGAAQGADELPASAREGLRRAARYFRTTISVEGAYLWSYSEDLKTRRGEEVATASQGWVQPPGTPSVGLAFLQAYQATGEKDFLDYARDAGRALARTQLASGGWDYRIEFDPAARGQWHYRTDVEKGDTASGRRRNVSTFDDNNSQSAMRLLLRLNRVLDGKDPEIHTALDYGLKKLLEAQYPNGAWPQRWDGKPHDPATHPVLKARYPETWPRLWPNVDYKGYYTFNDNAIRDVIHVMLEAHRTLKRDEYLNAARRGGEFMLLAQLPEPQPTWAQQYNLQMEPSWARKFEPASVTGGESVGVIRTLVDLYLYTGEDRFLKPIPPALEWFRRSRLPGDGGPRWARFYELRTNRPLYFTRQYELVYTDTDLPTHYSFQRDYGADRAAAYYEAVRSTGREAYQARTHATPTAERRRAAGREMETQVRAVLAALDTQGRWLEKGLIRAETFNKNAELLADYLAALAGKALPPSDFRP